MYDSIALLRRPYFLFDRWGKCNSGEESADCIRPLFDFTDEFTSFVLIKQIANYWNDSSLYLSFADRRFSDYLMITRQRVGSNIERQWE